MSDAPCGSAGGGGNGSDMLPRRPLGCTGHQATIFALGGEGILRTHGRTQEAVQLINRTLDHASTTATPSRPTTAAWWENVGGRRRKHCTAMRACEIHARAVELSRQRFLF